jgi:small GTP-binding protein
MTICLNFIDTAGQEIYQSLLPKNYIRNSHVVLLVFSDIDSFNTLKNRWYKFYKENSNIDNSKFILIGNKSDKFGDQREQITKYGNEFSQDIDALFVKCSAKNADGIDNLENFIITEARRFIDEEEKKINDDKINNNQKEETQSFRLKKKKKKDKKIWNCLCNK